jgi:hypothetical protein
MSLPDKVLAAAAVRAARNQLADNDDNDIKLTMAVQPVCHSRHKCLTK